MNSNSYFAQLYFPAFYFGTGGSTNTGLISAIVSGSSSLVSDLTDANDVVVYGYSAYTLTKVQPKFPEVTRASLIAKISGTSVVNGTLASSLHIAAIVGLGSIISADLTENKEARVRYRRRKEEEVLTYFLLAA